MSNGITLGEGGNSIDLGKGEAYVAPQLIFNIKMSGGIGALHNTIRWSYGWSNFIPSIKDYNL
jgi:hypothetical protein